MRRGLMRAVGITALVFVACFAVVLGVLAFGDPVVLALSGGQVAVVDVEGVIVDSERVVREIDEHVEDPAVRALVVRVQSPGGVVAPTQEIHDAILRARARGKPVVASLGSVAASGGYYLAVAADRIVANPGTLTGSIGVIMQLAEIEGLLRKVGVRYEVIKAGRYKDAGTISRPMTAEERAVLQEVLDDMHEQFVSAVALGRKLDRAAVLALADGRVYSGRRARELRLVDSLGGLEDSIRLAGALAGLPDRPRVTRPRRGLRLLDVLEWLTGRAPLGGLLPAQVGGGLPLAGSSRLPLYLMD